jgi:hypothetical protein
MPRSKQQIFVSFDDGSKAIKYFNPETQRVLTSRNYKFLTHLLEKSGTPEPIHIDLPSAVPREGEHDGGDLNHITLQPESQCTHKEREHEEPRIEGEQEKRSRPQRNLRQKAPVNYQRLNNPFEEEDDDNMYHTYTWPSKPY